ncbi:hypothetical protein NMY22_g9422 [Coprinellus aureogranulatus]|nr:hypothetical protein NMY22_g9422 [Coprinellus aureogranulatus]
MASSVCYIPSNPNVSGIGVRAAIYLQNFLSFIPAIWAIWDGRVSEYELESVETQATTNLVLAFAILISCFVQILTLGLTNYHVSIILILSWMNNTNAFVHFILYVQYKGQGRGVYQTRMVYMGGPHKEAARASSPLATSWPPITNFTSWEEARRTKKRHAAEERSKSTLSKDVALAWFPSPLAHGGARRMALERPSRWFWAGLNLFLPTAAFLSLYIWHQRRRREIRPRRLTFWTFESESEVSKTDVTELPPQGIRRFTLPVVTGLRALEKGMLRSPVFSAHAGLAFLSAVNIVFVVDIELTSRRNKDLQNGSDSDEAEWGFGQILAMLLTVLPLRDLIEAILRRRYKRQQQAIRRRELTIELEKAIFQEDLEKIKTLVYRGADVNSVSEGRSDMRACTVLQAACLRGELDEIRFLLESGADPNIIAGDHGTALQAACLRACRVPDDRVQVVELLFEWGAQPNVQGGIEGTALAVASNRHLAEIVKLLLDRATQLGDTGRLSKQRAVPIPPTVATRLPTLNLLAHGQRGKTPNTSAGEYGTALHVACWRTSPEVVQILLDKGADPNINPSECEKFSNYKSTLQLACDAGSSRIAQLLLERGAKPIPGDKHERLLVVKKDVDMLRALLQHGADPKVQDVVFHKVEPYKREFWPLIQCQLNCHPLGHGGLACAELLLEYGANVDVQDPSGHTALHLASSNGDKEMVEVLLRHGAVK